MSMEVGSQSFRVGFFKCLREQNKGFPLHKIEQLEMLESKFEPFIQLADLCGGIVKNELKDGWHLLHIVEEKALEIRHFPY